MGHAFVKESDLENLDSLPERMQSGHEERLRRARPPNQFE